ncbi:MAG: single-stranded DNA-binding protein [Tetragenococcus koreensis]|nr:single-stranded DNA-binding protein [Tetragenococcus koreensis]
MINIVTIVGRLTRDAELRYTGSGNAVASFTIAAERPYTNAQGERETDFINCVVWKKTAEALSNYTRKGSLIGITGRIQTRNYEGNDGKRVYVTEVVAESVKFLEPKKTNERHSESSEGNYASSNRNSTQGKNKGNNDYPEYDEDPFAGNNDSIDISDDDLPF